LAEDPLGVRRDRSAIFTRGLERLIFVCLREAARLERDRRRLEQPEA
jgi:hypothetical protein